MDMEETQCTVVPVWIVIASISIRRLLLQVPIRIIAFVEISPPLLGIRTTPEFRSGPTGSLRGRSTNTTDPAPTSSGSGNKTLLRDRTTSTTTDSTTVSCRSVRLLLYIDRHRVPEDTDARQSRVVLAK
jgi:hypothetical protein